MQLIVPESGKRRQRLRERKGEEPATYSVQWLPALRLVVGSIGTQAGVAMKVDRVVPDAHSRRIVAAGLCPGAA